METPAQDAFCSICRSTDFEKLFRSRKIRRIWLGRWIDVQRRRSCPFCRLVTRCIRDWPYQLPREHGPIVVKNEFCWRLCITSSEFDGSIRQTDYTNKLDLQSKRKGFTGRYDRRILVQEYGFGHYGQIQIIPDDIDELDGDDDDSQFLGRRVRPDQVSAPLLRSWLERCDRFHARSCREQARLEDTPTGSSRSSLEDGVPRGVRSPLLLTGSFSTEHLRFIDVKHMCIVRARSDCVYAAMSYVWGEDLMRRKMPRTRLRHTKEEIRMGYIPLPADLPATISDCIEVARSLGYQYLWNDALCIVQDDAKERSLHVTNMASIYNNADITIIAGSGKHADYGLPGVSRLRSHHQWVERVDGLTLGVVLPSYNDINDSSNAILPINTRGWTFQEKIMSRRILLFTDCQIYFRCKNAAWCEDTIMETEAFSKSVKRRSSPFAWVADRKHGLEVPPDESVRNGLVTWLQRKFSRVKPEARPDLGVLPNYACIVESYSPREVTRPEDVLNAISSVLRSLHSGLGDFYEAMPTRQLHRALLWAPLDGSIAARRSMAGPSWSWVGWNLSEGCIWGNVDLLFTTTYPTDGEGADGFGSIRSELRDSGRAVAILTQTRHRVVSGRYVDFPPATGLEAQSFRRYRTILHVQAAIVRFSISGLCTKSMENGSPSQHVYQRIVTSRGETVGEVLAPLSMQDPAHASKREFLILCWGKGMAFDVSSKFVPRVTTTSEVKISDDLSMPTSSTTNQGRSSWRAANVLLIGYDEDDVAQRIGIGKIVFTALTDLTLRNEWIFLG